MREPDHDATVVGIRELSEQGPVEDADRRPQGPELTVRALETPSLGDRSYLVHDGEVAFVVDPQRDVDRLLTILDSDQVRLTHVFETHIHNDYVTGGLALARATGARYLVNGDDAVSFDRTPIHDGETVAVGQRIRVRAIHTPGHTFTHLSYALTDAGRGNEPIGVFTGGSLLYGATGRPDLLGTENTDKLVRHQHASAHRLAGGLPNATGVYPTHGFGSFCSATQTNATESTIGQERRTNPVLTQDEETYVRELLDGLGAWPAYYIHMGRTNAAGPAAPDPVPTRARRGVGARRRRLPRSPRRSSTPPNARPSRSTTTSRTPSKPDSSCCDPRPDQLRQALNGP